MAGLQIDPAQIAKAREAGYSDDEIVGFLSSKSPEQFKAAQEAGYSSQEILNHFGNKAPSGIVAGFAKGLSDEIQGVGETAKQFAGVDNSRTNDVADKVAPRNYHADQVVPEGAHWYDPTSYNWKAIPQAIAEQAPSIGTALIAGRAASKLLGPKAGLVAGVGSMLLPTLGRSAKEDAAIRTGNPNAEPELQDKARAVATGLAQSVPAAVGLSRFMPGAGSAVKSTADAIKRAATTVAAEGAAAGAQDAIQQVGSTLGTKNGVQFDPNRTASQVVTGGVGGGLLSAPGVVGKGIRNAKTEQFAGDNQNASEAVANRIQAAADGSKLNTKGGFQAVKTASDDIRSELKSAVGDIGGRTALPENADSALRRAVEGRELTDADFKNIGDAVGSDPAGERVKDLARQAHVVAMLKRQGDFDEHAEKFTGGTLHGVSKQVRAFASPAGALATTGTVWLTGAAPTLFAYSPHTLAGLTALAGGLHAVDSITGSRSPTQRFTDRFSNPNTPMRAPLSQPPKVAPPDLSVGPWGPRLPGPSVPQVEAPSLAPVEPTLSRVLRANANVDQGIAKIVSGLAKARQKAMSLNQNDADWRVMRDQADSENAHRDLLWKLQRSQADSENAAFDAKNADANKQDAANVKAVVAQALSENKARDVLAKLQRSQADSENKTFNSDYRANQLQAISENRDRDRAAAAAQAEANSSAPEAPPIDPLSLPRDMVKRAQTIMKSAALVQKLRLAAEKEQATQQAAAEPPVIAKINKKLNGSVRTERAKEEPYSPIAADKLWRRGMSDEDVAKQELATYSPKLQQIYGKKIIGKRTDLRNTLSDLHDELMANPATEDAGVVVGNLFDQLDHIHNRTEARRSIEYHLKQMPKEVAATLRPILEAKVADWWKE